MASVIGSNFDAQTVLAVHPSNPHSIGTEKVAVTIEEKDARRDSNSSVFSTLSGSSSASRGTTNQRPTGVSQLLMNIANDLQALVKLNILMESSPLKGPNVRSSDHDESSDDDEPKERGASSRRVPVHRRHLSRLNVNVQKNVIYYSFVNSSLQELVYSRMNTFFRSKLHSNLAVYLERQYEDHLNKHKRLLAAQQATGSKSGADVDNDAIASLAMAIETDQNLLAYHWYVLVLLLCSLRSVLIVQLLSSGLGVWLTIPSKTSNLPWRQQTSP